MRTGGPLTVTLGAGALAPRRFCVQNVPVAAAVVASAGCGLLAARPVLALSTGPRVVLFTSLLVVGATWPLRTSAGQRATGATTSPFVVLAVGVAAFGLARLVGGGQPPVPALASFLLLNTLAAVAEEAFFRRFLYGALLASGTALAVVGSAVLFALVHVTIYGPWALPVDLGAGLLLSWQRLASGSWHVPAFTHAFANLVMVI